MKFSPETTYFRVPMETVHVILVVSGPSGGVEENPLKSCLSVSRVETGTPGGGGCVLVRHVS